MEIKKSLFFFLVLLSTLTNAQTPEETISAHINYWILVLFCLSISAITLISVIIIILEGVKFMKSEDLHEREKAKKLIIYAVIALIFVLVACPLVNFLIHGSEVSEFKCNCPPEGKPKSMQTSENTVLKISEKIKI